MLPGGRRVSARRSGLFRPIAQWKLPTAIAVKMKVRQGQDGRRFTEYKAVYRIDVNGKFYVAGGDLKQDRCTRSESIFQLWPSAGDLKYGSKNVVSIAGLDRQFCTKSLEIEVPIGKEGIKKWHLKRLLPDDLKIHK